MNQKRMPTYIELKKRHIKKRENKEPQRLSSSIEIIFLFISFPFPAKSPLPVCNVCLEWGGQHNASSSSPTIQRTAAIPHPGGREAATRIRGCNPRQRPPHHRRLRITSRPPRPHQWPVEMAHRGRRAASMEVLPIALHRDGTPYSHCPSPTNGSADATSTHSGREASIPRRGRDTLAIRSDRRVWSLVLANIDVEYIKQTKVPFTSCIAFRRG